MIEELKQRAKNLRDTLMIQKGQAQQIQTRLEEITVEKGDFEAKQNRSKEAILLCEFASKGARELVLKKIDSIVSFALQSVFGNDYEFKTEMEIKRNAIWARFYVMGKGYKEPADPMESRGGGVVDIISLALRMVFIELYTPTIEGPLILDEPTRNLSAEYAGRAAELLSALSDRTGRQVILVTHDALLAKEADATINL